MKKSLLLLSALLFSTTIWSQTIDPSFKFELLKNGRVLATATAPDGSTFVGGDLTYIDGKPVGRIVKMKSTGEIDDTFKLIPDPEFLLVSVQKIVIYPDGRLLYVGNVEKKDQTYTSMLFRANADGSLDESFNYPFEDQYLFLFDIGIQSDEQIIVCGAVSNDAAGEHFVKRLKTTGAVDDTFITPALGNTDYVRIVQIQSDDKIMVAGNFAEYNSVTTANNIARLKADGTFDNTFNLEIDWVPEKLFLLDDGSMFVYSSGYALKKVLSDGSPDATFDPFPNIIGREVAVLDNGTIMSSSSEDLKVHDLTGELLETTDFENDYVDLLDFGNGRVIAPFIDEDLKTNFIVFDSELFVFKNLFVTSYSDDSQGTLRQFTQAPDGSLIIKTFADYYYNGEDIYPIDTWFRLNSDLTYDPDFTYNSPDFSNYLYPVFVDSKGRIYVYDFDLTKDWLKRYTPDGTKDLTFTPIEGRVRDMIELANNEFVAVVGEYQTDVVKFDESGTIDESVTYHSNYRLSSIVADSEGKWYVLGGAPRLLDKLNNDGTPVSGFNPNTTIKSYDETQTVIFDDQIYSASSYYKENGATIIPYPLSIWDTNGAGKLVTAAELKQRVGLRVRVDESNQRIYLLSKAASGRGHELRALNLDGSLVKYFLPISYERNPYGYGTDNIFILGDGSLLLTSDSVYHVLLPVKPEGPTMVDVSQTEDNKIRITWQDNSDNEVAFEIWKSIDDGEFGFLTAVNADETELLDDIDGSGRYKYRVYAANAAGLSDDVEEGVIDVVVTGLWEQQAGLKVYPNPVRDRLQIQSENLVERFTMLQMDGRSLESAAPNSKEFTIHMNNYPAGIYLLKLEHSGGKKILKILKQ